MSLRLCFGSLIALAVGLTPSVAGAQQTCGWMPAQKLNELLPAGAPWNVMVGGAMGSCKFIGRGGSGGVAVLGAHQMLKSDAAEAVKTARSLRENLGENYRIEADPELGEQGFLYLPKDDGGAGGRLSASYVGHYKHVVITGQLVMPVGGDFGTYRAGASAFMRAALSVADDAAATAAAAQCPYLDETIARKLLPGDGFSQQAFGANSCMAQNGKSMALTLSVMEGRSSDVAARMRDASCTWSPVAELGTDAVFGHDCSAGNPRALLQTMLNGKLLSYAFVPGREPTAAERALLIELVRAVSTQ